jgi:ABC-2 type transport system ATP-binding protein
MATPALKVDGIVKRFGNHVAVDGVSFEVPRGVVYGVLGPNGAGKSTTLRMINDIIAPDEGRIAILDGLAPGLAAARKIGYLPEERGMYPKMRVRDAIAFMAELRGLTPADAKARAIAWLDRLGLGAWADNKLQDLSKGMQQKVQFATALIHEPELVILDEPWSGLDPINAEVLREVVEQVIASGRTVVFSTHQMEQAEKLCDHVCIIARGRLVLAGVLADIKRAAANDGRVALVLAGGDAVLADTALVAKRETSDDVVEVTLAEGVAADQLLSALVGAGAKLRRFEVVTPSLHDIFVSRVGRDNATVAARREEA